MTEPDTNVAAGTIIGEVIVFLSVVTAFLVVSDRVGAGSLPGAFIGWGGLMIGIALVGYSLARRRQNWSSIGLGRPRNWLSTIGLAVLAAVVLTVVGGLAVSTVIVPLFGAPDSSRFAQIAGNPLFLAFGLFSVWTSAAFGEEILMRGYAMGRLAAVFGGGRSAWIASLVVTSTVFGIMHFYQGTAGVVLTGFIGLLIGTAYLAVGRNLWVVVIAHGLIDTMSFVQVYLSGR